MLFITVQPNGEYTEFDIAEGEPTYDAIKAGVRGWVEPIDYANDLTHYHNEEFLYAEGEVFDQINYATILVSVMVGVEIPRIYGPVVFTGGADDEGETCGLSPARAAIVRLAADKVREDHARLVENLPPLPKPEPRVQVFSL